MKALFVIATLAVAACSSGPPPLNHPPKDAAVWDLNPGRWPGTNKLIQEASLVTPIPEAPPKPIPQSSTPGVP